MIELTKLNHEKMILNALYIEKIEATPDTMITLLSGKKVLVLESVEEASKKATNYFKKINVLNEIGKQASNREED
jgi:flagellar protein FlbD